MAKMKGIIDFNLEHEIKRLTKELNDEVFKRKEKGLDKASEFMLVQLRNATPSRSGRTRMAWSRTTKYKGVRYLSNSALNNRDIPIINLLEYSSKGKPFVRKTFEQNQERVLEIIKKEVL